MIELYEDYMKIITNAIKDLNNPDDQEKFERIVKILRSCRERRGRVFIAGMGGSAANGQHMANDLRKMANIDAINLSDNIAELTARANDDGFETIYVNSLRVSNFEWKDVLFILSVSGGSYEKNASMGLVHAIDYAVEKEGTVVGIVGMEDSVTARNADIAIITPFTSVFTTQVSEALQAVIWHGLVSDERLMVNKAKW